MSATPVNPPVYVPPLAWRKIPMIDRQDLANRADFAVAASFAHARRVMNDPNPSEPNLVLSFFLHGLEQLERDWNDALKRNGVRLTLSGVFSHQTPKVVPLFPDPNSKFQAEQRLGTSNNATCELGDLLVVVLHDGATPRSGLAWMLQAKKGFGNGTDALQRTLYEHSDHFEYQRSTPKLNRQQRLLPAKDSLALSYWDIEEDFAYRRWLMGHPVPSTHAIHAADAKIDHFSRHSFGGMLTQLIFGDAGEPFRLGNPRNYKSPWSNIVYDLLSVTAEKLVTSRIGNARRVPRGWNTDMAVRQHLQRKGVVVRNSLGNALRMLSRGFSEAAEALDKCEPLKIERDVQGRGDKMPPIESLDIEDDGSGGPTLVVVHCHQE